LLHFLRVNHTNANTDSAATSTATPTTIPAIAAFEKLFEPGAFTTAKPKASDVMSRISYDDAVKSHKKRKAFIFVFSETFLRGVTFIEAEKFIRADDREGPFGVRGEFPVGDDFEQSLVLSWVECGVHWVEVHEHVQAGARLPLLL
jgi:hypothetical protein